MKKPELLAPAGDLERLKIAILYGADAVYIGGAFNLRANADNFKLEEIKQGVEFAHKLNKKVYVTLNIAMHNKEYEKIEKYIKELDKINVDAIIISDPAILKLAKGTNLDIHLSTQASTLNKSAVEFWKKEGVTRIVLARECTKEDIKNIKENVDIELEVFIHGAMCASYSGRCVLSNFLTQRDSNRGGCSQICRWDFDLYDESAHLQAEKPFTFCTKDLSMAKYIPDLINLNVDSLKIEGRMRSIYYIATVIKVYRTIIDNYCNNKEEYEYNKQYESILQKVANRDSIPQFFDGNYGKSVQYYNGRQEITNQDFLGLVISYDEKTNLAKVQQRNYFKKNDTVEVFGPTNSFKFKVKNIYDEDYNPIEIVRHPKQIVYIKMPQKVKQNDMMKMVDKG
ncbi:MAG: U32 family peptidase [Bacilli bacterium]|nr:U32 family peptidase [Bacilli bacterium]